LMKQGSTLMPMAGEFIDFRELGCLTGWKNYGLTDELCSTNQGYEVLALLGCFGTSYQSHFQGSGLREPHVGNYQPMPSNIPQEWRSHIDRGLSLNANKDIFTRSS
jgi:hypothetical protein